MPPFQANILYSKFIIDVLDWHCSVTFFITNIEQIFV